MMRKTKIVWVIVLALLAAVLACDLPFGGGQPTAAPTSGGVAPVNTEVSNQASPQPTDSGLQPPPTAEPTPGPAIPTAVLISPPLVGGKYDWTALDAMLASYVPGTVKGMTLIVARDGNALFFKGYGDQAIYTIQPIASASMVPSAMAILTLVDEGRLSLDEPIATYLAGQVDFPADKAAITMRMLLNNTSGIPQETPCVKQRSDMTLRKCAEEIINTPLEAAPGAQFGYSLAGYQLAGFVATAITNLPWNQFFSERIAVPLGLSTYTYGKENNPMGSDKGPRVDSGAATDANDYNTILQMFLAGGQWNGKQILSPAMIAEMQKDQTAGLPKVRVPQKDLTIGYTFGFWITNPAKHPGSNGPELTDQGYFGSMPWVDLSLRYSAVLLMKEKSSEGTDIWKAIRPLIIEQLLK